jgi:quinol monooxygenase YgiN
MPGVCAVVAYRPKPGKERELLELVRNRVPTLRKEGLVTDRTPTIMRSRDGTILEVSEWKSRDAIDAAQRIRTSSRCGTNSLPCAIASRSTRSPKLPTCSPASRRWKTDIVQFVSTRESFRNCSSTVELNSARRVCAAKRLYSVIREVIVRITVKPSLVRLGRCNHRMSDRPRMFARVLVR